MLSKKYYPLDYTPLCDSLNKGYVVSGADLFNPNGFIDCYTLEDGTTELGISSHEKENVLYFGLEIEFNNIGPCWEKIRLEFLIKTRGILGVEDWTQIFSVKYDSTLVQGREISFKPMTWCAFQKIKVVIEILFDLIDEYGSIQTLDVVDPDTGEVVDTYENEFPTSVCAYNAGLHIHVNRGYFGEYTESFQGYLSRLIYIADILENEIMREGGRDENEVNSDILYYYSYIATKIGDASPLHRYHPLNEDPETLAGYFLQNPNYNVNSLWYDQLHLIEGCRYQWLNMTNQKTLEFRHNRSTTSIDELESDLQVIFNLARLVKYNSLNELNKAGYTGLHDYVFQGM